MKTSEEKASAANLPSPRKIVQLHRDTQEEEEEEEGKPKKEVWMREAKMGGDWLLFSREGGGRCAAHGTDPKSRKLAENQF